MDRPEVAVGTPVSDAAARGGDPQGKDSSNSRRAAACLVCRRSKIKCEKGRAHNDDRCQRCLQLGVQCVRPDFHVGRRKGVKNKRTGLEKALHQVEQAVRRSGSAVPGIEAAKVVSELKALLGPANANGSTPRLDQSAIMGHNRQDPGLDIILPDASSDAGDSSASDHEEMSIPQDSTPAQSHNADESLAVDDAENPLQLLARASDLHVSPKSGNEHVAREVTPHQRARHSKQNDRISEVEKFFKLSQFSLDIGPDLDPIELGLLSLEEADSLFNL